MVKNYRLYTALYYLNKGIIQGFLDCLCLNSQKEEEITKNEDFLKLLRMDYISYINNRIVITKKGSDLFIKKHKIGKDENDITDEYVNKFLEGFPSNRYGEFKILLDELKRYYIGNEYSKEYILKAKEQYIKDMAAQNFMFIKHAHNFVIKDLDNYCRYISLDDKNKSEQYGDLFME